MSKLEIISSENSKHDLLSLGAIVVRLDPGTVPFSMADSYKIHVSGGEYNVAANLSACFKLRTAIAGAMVDGLPLAEKVKNVIRESGVHPYYVHFTHDGVRGPNIAQVWSDCGYGIRPPVVFYNRANEAAGLLNKDSFEWENIFKNGIRWFHSGGIFSSLSESTPEVILEAMKTARKNGAVTSFDLNYRAKLWSACGGIKKAQAVLSSIVEYTDFLVGNEEDLQLGLGIDQPEDQKNRGELDPETFLEMIKTVKERFPNIKAVATTLRKVHSANRHSWSAVLWYDGQSYKAPVCDIDVYDRVGGGDGFASGLFYGFLTGRPPQESLMLGWAHGALVATYPGDTSMADLRTVEDIAKGGSARIQR